MRYSYYFYIVSVCAWDRERERRVNCDPIRHVGKVLMTKLFIYLLTCAFVEFIKGCCATVDIVAVATIATAAVFFVQVFLHGSMDCVLYTLSTLLTSNFLGVLVLFDFALVK